MSHPRRLILWDLDGTLCPHNAQFHNDAPLAVAQAALKLGANISFVEAIEFARANYPGQRTAVRAFAEKFGLKEDLLFQHYYTFLRTDFLTWDPDLIQSFTISLTRYEHGILTQAPESWALRTLQKRGLTSCFTPELIFGTQHLQQQPKTAPAAQKILTAACAEKGYPRDRLIIVDDKLQVLTALEEVATTRIWITANKQPDLDFPMIIPALNPEAVLAL